METKDSLDSLKNSLIYTMSLGSRELYHSNVWAWLIRKDSRFVKAFFKGFDEKEYDMPEHIDVWREKDHLDVSFVLKRNVDLIEEFFIIENKIKSLATIEQLNRYTEVLNKRGYAKIHAIYTGIEDTLTEDQKNSISGVQWSFRSYEDIGTSIGNMAQEMETSTDEIEDPEKRQNYKRMLNNINEYAETVVTMSQTLSSLLKENNDAYSFKTKSISADKLDEQGLYDIYKKLKGCEFLEYVKDRFSKDEDISSSFSVNSDRYVIYFGQDFNRKKVTLDFRWAHDDEFHAENGWNGKRVIGIQIEDYDYRFVYGISPASHNKSEYDDAFNEICHVDNDDKWLDEYYKDHKGKLFNRDDFPTSLSVPKTGEIYNKYGGANHLQTFIYQYYNLPGKSSKNKNEDLLTYDKLYNRIKSDLLRAEEIIKKMPILN